MTHGIVELHGATLMVRMANQVFPLPMPNALPGDTVEMDGRGAFTFVSRTEQVLLGVVRRVDPLKHEAELYLPMWPACPYQPVVSTEGLEEEVHVTDRIIVWCQSNGTLNLRFRFSAAPHEDVPCLLAAYTYLPSRIPELPCTKAAALYTRPDVVDLRHENIFTIDPTHSIDLDDAISVDVERRIVSVHIVDIAHALVTEEDHRRMRERCFTLYLANEHVEHLMSNVGHVSLDQGKDRGAITIQATINEEGLVTAYEIFRSIIHVKHRYDYATVATMLESEVTPAWLNVLKALSLRRSETVQYLHLPSTVVDVDAQTGLANGVVMDVQDLSHDVVATSMIMANLIVSKHLRERGIVLPNRFHEQLSGIVVPDSHVHLPHPQVDAFVLVKKYARARYDIDQRGHFGLGLTDYVHFTSPMRRYADVIVHRLLAGWQYDRADMERMVAHLNQQANFTRNLQQWYTLGKVVRLLPVGFPTNLWVTSIKKAGVQWYVPEYSLNGFLHVSQLLPKQYWQFEGDRLIGTKTGVVVTVGSSIPVELTGYDLVTWTIQWRVVAE